MHISWNFLDKKKATIAALEAYNSMKFIIQHTDEEIMKEQMNMIGVSSPKPDGMPHAHDPKAGEDRLIQGIDEIDVLKERYRQAKEYMDWFQPAWNQLSEEEQYILGTFFLDGNGYGSNAANDVMRALDIEYATVYKYRSRAIDRLTVLLFGKS